MCLRERMVQKVLQVCQRVLPTCETLVCCFVERHALLSVRLKAEKTKRASYSHLHTWVHARGSAHVTMAAYPALMH